jgi:hypothetical protein
MCPNDFLLMFFCIFLYIKFLVTFHLECILEQTIQESKEIVIVTLVFGFFYEFWFVYNFFRICLRRKECVV